MFGINCCLFEACAAPPHVRLTATITVEYLAEFRQFLRGEDGSAAATTVVSLRNWEMFERSRARQFFSLSDLETMWIVFSAVAMDSGVAINDAASADPMEISVDFGHFALLLFLQVRRSEARHQQTAARAMRHMESANALSSAQHLAVAASTSATLLSPRRLSSSSSTSSTAAAAAAAAYPSSPQLGSAPVEPILPAENTADGVLAFVQQNLNSLLRVCALDFAVGRLPPSVSLAALNRFSLILDDPSIRLGPAVAGALGEKDSSLESLPWTSVATFLQAELFVNSQRQPVAARKRRRRSDGPLVLSSSPRGSQQASEPQQQQPLAAPAAFLQTAHSILLEGVRRESVYVDQQSAVRVKQRRSSQLLQRGETPDVGRAEEVSEKSHGGNAAAALQCVYLSDLQDCTVVLLRPVRYLMISSCLNCTVTATSVLSIVSLQACKYVRLNAIARCVRFENCYGPQASLYCYAPPAVCGDTRAATLGPLGLILPEAPALPLIDKFVNRFALPTVSEAGTTHVPFNVRINKTAPQSHADSYQLLQPEKLEIMSLVGGADETTAVSVPLPQIYYAAFVQRQEKAAEVLAALEKMKDKFEGGAAAYGKALQTHFLSWMLQEGHLKDLTDLCRVEALFSFSR